MRKSVNWAIWVVVIAAVVGALGAIFAALVGREPSIPPGVAGEILSPRPREVVGRSFKVGGRLANIPEGYHVWLVVEIENLLWPKEPEIPSSDRRWSRKVVEGGNPPGGIFSLSLQQVPPKGQRFVLDWLRHGSRTGDYPGLDSIPGAIRLDIVEDLRLR